MPEARQLRKLNIAFTGISMKRLEAGLFPPFAPNALLTEYTRSRVRFRANTFSQQHCRSKLSPEICDQYDTHLIANSQKSSRLIRPRCTPWEIARIPCSLRRDAPSAEQRVLPGASRASKTIGKPCARKRSARFERGLWKRAGAARRYRCGRHGRGVSRQRYSAEPRCRPARSDQPVPADRVL